MIGNGRVFIIAEAGVNHNGSFETAKELVAKAKWAGADAIKFQTWKTENVVTRSANSPEYQKLHTDALSQFDMLKKLELRYSDFSIIKDYCDNVGITFMSTADEYESALFLNSLVDIFKIGSAELTDWPFLRKIAAFNKPVILSTGMGNMTEITNAANILFQNGLDRGKIIVLHANTEYPTPFKDVNLRAMNSIGNLLQVRVGYSDHTLGIEVPIAAVAMGACVIEKHFTLDRKMKGPDHSSSLEPEEFRRMVDCIRNIEVSLGDGIKRPSESELINIKIVRKSIVAKVPIKKGEVLSENNITVKRPGYGISPDKWDYVVGSQAERDYEVDNFIENGVD